MAHGTRQSWSQAAVLHLLCVGCYELIPSYSRLCLASYRCYREPQIALKFSLGAFSLVVPVM